MPRPANAIRLLIAFALGGCESRGTATVDWTFTTAAGAVEPCPSEVARVFVEIRGKEFQAGFFEEHELACATGTSGPLSLALGDYEATTLVFRSDDTYATATTRFALSDDPASPQTEVLISEDFIVDGGRVDVVVSLEGGFLGGPIGCLPELPMIGVSLEQAGVIDRHDVPCQQTSTIRTIAGSYTATISLLDPAGNPVHTSPPEPVEVTAPNGGAVIGHTFSGL